MQSAKELQGVIHVDRATETGFESNVDPIGDIVVTATLRNDGLYAWFMDLDRAYSRQERLIQDRPTENITVIGRRPTNIKTSLPTIFHSSVNVSISENSPQFSEAMKAAENVATALTKVQALLADLPPNRTIHWGNRTMTVQQVLNEINNTKFIITDSLVDNGSAGSALWKPGNRTNEDKLYFEAFDGDRDISSVTSNGEDYADPNYLRGEGMMAIMLHEIGHMNKMAFDFDDSSHRAYKRENNNRLDGYNNSDYWRNNEAYVNDFTYNLASTIGFDVSSVPLIGGTSWTDPWEMFNDRRGYRTPADGFEGNSHVYGHDDFKLQGTVPYDAGYGIAIA